jgi:ribosome-associated translation inhibitor RaiA
MSPRKRTRARAAQRPRLSESTKREPFAAEVPRPVRRVAGRVPAPTTPAHVRVMALALGDEPRRSIRERLGMQLGKFARNIERISVRLDDVNGPKGGVDRRCQIKVVVDGLPSIVSEAQATHWWDAFNVAVDGAEEAVRRALRRRRTKSVSAETRRR